jgi:hypothetical protein
LDSSNYLAEWSSHVVKSSRFFRVFKGVFVDFFDFICVFSKLKSHAECQNYTRACGIATSQNPIRIFFDDLTLILVASFKSHTYRVEIQLVRV